MTEKLIKLIEEYDKKKHSYFADDDYEAGRLAGIEEVLDELRSIIDWFR